MAGSSSSDSGINTAGATVHTYLVMPCPGQPGALYFDGMNISEFLKNWDIEYEDFDLTNEQKCFRFVPRQTNPRMQRSRPLVSY